MLHIGSLMLVLFAAPVVALAGELPRLDVEASCRAAQPLNGQDRDPYQGCMRDEMEARTQLEQQWASFNDQYRDTCIQETNVEGSPSYVDVLTCLQMYAGMSPPNQPAHRARRGQ
jgi:hypothetical protein